MSHIQRLYVLTNEVPLINVRGNNPSFTLIALSGVSGERICSCSRVSVEHMILHSYYSLLSPSTLKAHNFIWQPSDIQPREELPSQPEASVIFPWLMTSLDNVSLKENWTGHEENKTQVAYFII